MRFLKKRKKYSSFLALLIFSLQFAFIGHTVRAASAELLLYPATKTIAPGNRTTVKIEVHTDVGINAADGEIIWPNDILKVVNIDSHGSFKFWQTPPTLNQTTNSIVYAGGTLGSISGTKTIFSITVQAKKQGVATLSFRHASILAADGSGTNILNRTEHAVITVAEPGQKVPNSPILHSSTHPDQTTWYNNNSGSIEWSDQSNISAIATSIDQNLDGNPSNETTPSNTYSFSNLTDGVWYAHVKLKNATGWSQPSTYILHIDTTPPIIRNILLPDTDKTVQRHPYISFIAEDNISGIAKITGSVNNGPESILNPISENTYELPLLNLGKNNLKISVTDKAGNKTSDQKVLSIVTDRQGKTRVVLVSNENETKIFMFFGVLVLLFIILILVFLYILWEKKTNKTSDTLN